MYSAATQMKTAPAVQQQERKKNILSIIDPTTGHNVLEDMDNDKKSKDKSKTPPPSSQSAESSSGNTPTPVSAVAGIFLFIFFFVKVYSLVFHQ